MVIVDVNPKDELEIPTEAYVSMESKPEEKSEHRRTFVHLPSEIGAYEPEEVGVEHLLRNIRDIGGSTLSDQVKAKVSSLKGLKKRMEEMYEYLDGVCAGRFAPNHQIIYNIQDIFNLSPDLKVKELVQSFANHTNDNYLVIYLSSLVRSITALHDLINNKLKNRALEKEAAEGEKAHDEVREKVDATKKADTSTDVVMSDKGDTSGEDKKEKGVTDKKDIKSHDEKDKDKKEESVEDKEKKEKEKADKEAQDRDKLAAAKKKKRKKKDN
jgi:26S proteasome regulatory subunit N8